MTIHHWGNTGRDNRTSGEGAMIIGWLILSWLGGIAAILGSLMTIASLAMWAIEGDWKRKLRVLGFSIACAIVGFTLLRISPSPFQ
jgi:hypothetical protein